MDLLWSEIAGYSTKRVLFIPFVFIYDRNKKYYRFFCFPVKKLQAWLEQVGMRKAVGGLHCRYVIMFVVLRKTAAQQIVTKRSYYGYFEFGFYNT